MGLSSSWRLHLAAWLGQRRPSSLLFVGSMNVSWTFPPYSVGGMGLIVCALQNWHRFRCVVALAGASQRAVVSAVVLSTAVVVHTAVAQAVASASLVQTMTICSCKSTLSCNFEYSAVLCCCHRPSLRLKVLSAFRQSKQRPSQHEHQILRSLGLSMFHSN